MSPETLVKHGGFVRETVFGRTSVLLNQRIHLPTVLLASGLGLLYLLAQTTGRADTNDYTFVTLAGQAGSAGSMDGTNGAALFALPNGMAFDSAGNAYVAEWVNETIRKITPGGVVTTFAGTAGEKGSTDGTGSVARFYGPAAVAMDHLDNLYVADFYNHAIRKITPDAVVTTLAGGSYGIADGTGTNAQFIGPNSVSLDKAGNVYVSDIFANTVRKITPDGVVTTFAGRAVNGPAGGGSLDGVGTNALFYQPYSVAVNSTGSVYVADTGNYTIRKITPDGAVTTFVGQAGVKGDSDGIGSAARLWYPYALAVDSDDNIFVADQGGRLIRKISGSGAVTTVAGNDSLTNQRGEPIGGYADGTGIEAQFSGIQGIAVNNSGFVYIADSGNNVIRKGFPALVISDLNRSGSSFSATFRSLNATGCVVEYTDSLIAPDWKSLPEGVQVNGVGMTFTDSAATSGQRFYRVRQP